MFRLSLIQMEYISTGRGLGKKTTGAIMLLLLLYRLCSDFHLKMFMLSGSDEGLQLNTHIHEQVYTPSPPAMF